MKKAISMILALVLCLSLCACGEDNSSETQNTSDDTTIVENQNETTSDLTPTETEVEETEPQFTTVEITIDNWDQYFENAPYIKYSRNDFDEITTVTISSSLKLKEEYKLADGAGSDVRFEMELQWETRGCTVDFTTGSVEFGKVIKTEGSSTKTTSFTDIVYMRFGDYLTTFGSADQVARDDEDVKADEITIEALTQMVRAEGTLVIHQN